MEFDETYTFGKSKVHIVAPSDMSADEKQKRINQMNKAFCAAWRSLPINKQKQINKKYKTENT